MCVIVLFFLLLYLLSLKQKGIIISNSAHPILGTSFGWGSMPAS